MAKKNIKIITLLKNVHISMKNGLLYVFGIHGMLSIQVSSNLLVNFNESYIKLCLKNEYRYSLLNSTFSLIKNSIAGVAKKFYKELFIIGLGYSVSVYNRFIVLKLGYSHDVIYHIPENIKIVCKNNNQIKIEGCDKYLVGQTSADIRNMRKTNKYTGKGVRYSNEIVTRKSGKKK